MAPIQRRAALRRLSLTIAMSIAGVVVLFALLAPASWVGDGLHGRLMIALVGGATFTGALLLGMPQKRRSRVTAPRAAVHPVS